MIVIPVAVAAYAMMAMAHGTSPQPAEPPAPSAVTIPLELSAGRPVLSVRVNGAGPFRLLVDPLAAVTQLDISLIEELRLRRSAARSGQAAATHHVDLQIGALPMLGVRAEPVDMAPWGAGFSPLTRPRGILGGDVWLGRLLTLDFGRWRVGLASGSLPQPDGASVFSIDPGDIAAGIPIDVAGSRATTTMDVLFAGGLVLPASTPLRPALAKGPTLVRTMPTRETAIVVEEMTLAGDITLLTVVFGRPALLMSRQVRVPTLGTAWLSSFVVIIDAANRRVRLVPRPPS